MYAPNAVLQPPLAGLSRRMPVAQETVSLRNRPQRLQAAYAPWPASEHHGENAPGLRDTAGGPDEAARADEPPRPRRRSRVVASARSGAEAEAVDPVEFCRSSVRVVQQAMMDVLWIDEAEKGRVPSIVKSDGIGRGETSIPGTVDNRNRHRREHSFGGWDEDLTAPLAQSHPQLASSSYASVKALTQRSQQGDATVMCLEEGSFARKTARAGTMHFPIESNLVSAGESGAGVVGRTGTAERSEGVGRVEGLCNAEGEREGGLFDWWQSPRPSPSSRTMDGGRGDRDAEKEGATAAVATAAVAAAAHRRINGSNASVRAKGNASASASASGNGSGSTLPSGEFSPMVAVAAVPVAGMPVRARQLAGPGADGGASASVHVPLTRRWNGGGERQAQEVRRVRAIGARSSGEGETEGASEGSGVPGDRHIDHTSSDERKAWRGADMEVSSDKASAQGSLIPQANVVGRTAGQAGQGSDTGGGMAALWWGQEGQGDGDEEDGVEVVGNVAVREGQSTVGMLGSREGDNEGDMEEDLEERVKALEEEEEEEEDEEEEVVAGDGGSEPASVMDDPWDVVSRFWHHPAVVKIRMSITMTNLTMALPTFLANVLPIIRSIRLPLLPVLLHEVSLPLLAPVLFGGGIVFKATLNNLGVVLPRVGIAVGLLWVLWACNTVLQQAIGRATHHQYLDRSVAHVLRIGIELAMSTAAVVTVLSSVGVRISTLVLPIFLVTALAGKDLWHNYFGGFFLFAARPFRPGDSLALHSNLTASSTVPLAPASHVTLGTGWFEGTCESVDLRYTVVRSGRLRLFVPNAHFLSREFVVVDPTPLVQTPFSSPSSQSVTASDGASSFHGAYGTAKESAQRSYGYSHDDLPSSGGQDSFRGRRSTRSTPRQAVQQLQMLPSRSIRAALRSLSSVTSPDKPRKTRSRSTKQASSDEHDW